MANTSKYPDEIRIQELIDEIKRRLATKVDKSSSPYTAGGSISFANLPAATEINRGLVYNITDAFVTTASFLEGPGIKCSAGTDVAIVKIPNSDPAEYAYNIYSGNATPDVITSEELASMWKDPGVLTLTANDNEVDNNSTLNLSISSSIVLDVVSSGSVIAESSNSDIASVNTTDTSITITGVSTGTAVVTITVAETLNNRSVSKTINVEVRD